MKAAELRRWRQFDLLLLIAALGLVCFGVAMIHSATCSPNCARLFQPSPFAARQLMYTVAGLGVMALITALDYRVFRTFAYPLFAGVIATLILVLVLGRGQEEWGARRWVQLGVFDFQPSEIAKVATVLALARWLGGGSDDSPGLLRVIGSVFFLALPSLLIFSQPDLGTAAAYVFIWFGMLVAARVKGSTLVGILLTGLFLLPVMWFALRDYMRQRLFTFIQIIIDPESDIFGEGYNILQARISIGSGGMLGRGFGQGLQNQYDYLRVKHSDFIFSVLAEELGFIGALLLISLFVLLLLRVARATERATDPFARLVVFGLGCMFLFQAFVNLGANLTVLPVTGVPLPLVSFGGSALLTNFIALGIIQSILVRRTRYRY